MHLYVNYQNHLHLKNDKYETIEKAKNESEKVELLIKIVEHLLEQINELKILLETK